MPKRTSIIVVESHPLLRSYLASTLTEKGLLILGDFEPGAEIETAVRTLKPDLALISVNAQNGEELRMISFLHKKYPQLKIAALLGSETPAVENEARNSGADLVLSKTLSKNKIMAALKKHLH